MTLSSPKIFPENVWVDRIAIWGISGTLCRDCGRPGHHSQHRVGQPLGPTFRPHPPTSHFRRTPPLTISASKSAPHDLSPQMGNSGKPLSKSLVPRPPVGPGLWNRGGPSAEFQPSPTTLPHSLGVDRAYPQLSTPPQLPQLHPPLLAP